MEILKTFSSIVSNEFSNSSVPNKEVLISLFNDYNAGLHRLYLDIDKLDDKELDNVHFLDVKGKNIEKLPKRLELCENLQVLDTSNNPLRDLSSIKELKRLKILILAGCGKIDIESIRELESLHILILRQNEIDNYDFLSRLKNLNILSISETPINSLSNSFENADNLFMIYLRKNNLKELPSEIGNAINIGFLHVIDNKLASIPTELSRLTRAISLSFNKNRLERIPMEIGSLISLREFYVNTNRISEIPKSIGQLINLKQLDLSINNLFDLPSEIDDLINLEYFDIKRNYLPENKKTIWYNFMNRIEKKKFIYSRVKVPGELRNAIKQYMIFFREYVLSAKRENIHYEVRDWNEGIEIETYIDGGEAGKKRLDDYFFEYMEFTQDRLKILAIEPPIETKSVDLLKLKLELQVNHLEQQLKIAEVEKKQLKGFVDQLLDTSNTKNDVLFLSTPQIARIDYDKRKSEVKELIGKGKIKAAIERHMKNRDLISGEVYNQLVILYSRFNQLEVEQNMGVIDSGFYNQELNKIRYSLVVLVDE